MPESPANILLFITDNQRRDTLGFRGETACRTPNMDRIAREGVSFDNAMTTCPICAPARSSIFTGLYPYPAGMPTNADDFVKDPHYKVGLEAPVFTGQLRQAGYGCYNAGKWHLGDEELRKWFDGIAGEVKDYSAWCKEQGIPDGNLFSVPHDPPYRSHRPPGMSIPQTGVLPFAKGMDISAWIVNNALDLLDSRDRDRPFFLVCSLEGPHQPFVVPEEYYDLYDPAKIPEPGNFNPGPGEPRCLERSYYRLLRNDWGTTWEAWQKSVAVYWALVTYVDELFGKVLSRLEDEKLLDNTLVIVVSDHGEMLGQHGLWHKMCPYEEAVRVPLLMRLPGAISPNKRCRANVSHIDIAPTILSAAGISPPGDWPGINLVALAGDSGRRPVRRDIFSQYTVHKDWDWHKVKHWRAVVRGPWKFIYHHGDREEFYNLKEDPGEMQNLAEDPSYESRLRSLRGALLSWMARSADPLTEQARSRLA